jgi:thiol:disulfide interchange protein
MIQAAMEYVQKHGPLIVEATPEAPDRPRSPQELAESVVSLEAQWIDPKQLALLVRIQPPFHINTNAPSKDLIATELRVTSSQAVESIDYPAGMEHQFGFSDVPLLAYSGDVQIAVRFDDSVNESIQMSLQYQACDESACLAPVTKRFEIRAP